MTPEDYALVKRIFVWARAHGWTRDHSGSCGQALGTRCWVDDRDSHIGLSREGYLETPISGTDCYDVEMAVDHLAGVKVLPVEMHSAYAAGVESIPWQYCVTDGVDIRLFDSYEQAAAWAAPTGEGHPRLSVRRQRRGPWEVAA